MSAEATLSRFRLMERASRMSPLNPMIFVEPDVLLSSFIAGRHPTPEELQEVVNLTDRLGVLDVTADNVIMSAHGPIVVDWFMRGRQSSCPGPDRDRGTAPT